MEVEQGRVPLAVVSCEGCGACCAHQGTPPFCGFVGELPPPHLMWDIQAYQHRYDNGEPCLWYDTETRRCQHYEHRPLACREFEVGEADCLRMRAEEGIDAATTTPRG